MKDHQYDVSENVALKNYTTLHLGGEATLLVKPKTVEEIENIIKLCKNHNISYVFLGNGSNVLVRDEGFAGVVIVLVVYFHHVFLKDQVYIHAQSGASVKAVCAVALRESLTGLEFACGIPGSIGGAAYMNAGAYGGEMVDVIESVTFLNEEDEIQTLHRGELGFSYRHSVFSNRKICILEVVFLLRKGEPIRIKERMDELMEKRRNNQPLESYSAGSTFKRPLDNYASALIAASDLKGYQVGDAMVSKKHSGFLINNGNASSRDFLQLIEDVKQKVYEDSGYKLECEIKMIEDM